MTQQQVFENPADLYFKGLALYDAGGLPKGTPTGWRCLNEYFNVGTGQITVITGVPGCGKSEWLDALLVNLAEQEDWFFGMYSPENFPTIGHMIKLAEKRMRKPFAPGPRTRMTKEEYYDGSKWVNDHFTWLTPEYTTPDELIATSLLLGPVVKRGIVLDPWNTLDHQRMGMTETDYVSFILTKVIQLARSTGAHIFLVVHPAKIPRNRDGTRPLVTPYDISGSAHWYNKSDNIITVHREQLDGSQDVEIHVQKVRFKHLGHPGIITLKYDKVTGRYFESNVGPTTFDKLTGKPDLFADPESDMPPPTLDAERIAIQSE